MLKTISRYFELIKFSHSIFALPFALIPVLILIGQGFQPALPWVEIFLWIVVAMVGARSGAMGFNRLVDRKFDAENPRTQNRPSATGEVSPLAMSLMILVSYAALVLAAYQLNPLAFYLSPVAIFLVSFYSWTKRFTWACHLFLGLAIGAAPIASQIAVTGAISPLSLALGFSVLCWIAGFDVLYALQDLEYDRQKGLSSIPVKIGVAPTLWLAKLLHLGAFVAWVLVGLLAPLGIWFWIAVGLCGLLLIYEHSLVKPTDLSKLNLAFFNMNAVISVTLFLGVGLDLALG